MTDRDKREPTGRRSREPSDMFAVQGTGRSITQIREVPLTREELAERRRRRAIMAGIAVLAVLGAIYGGWRFMRHREVVSACAAAESSGRLVDIDAALALLEGSDDPADVALSARLLATAVLAGETDRREAATAFLGRHDASGDGASDHRIAAAYLALAEDDPAAAAREAALLVAGRGPRAAEAAHARAVTALALGNLEAAEAAAEAAREDMTGSPRHEALLFEIRARRGEPVSAAGDADPTVLRAARARAALETGDATLARAEAEAVLAAADATPAETAWAHLVLAVLAQESGDTIATLEALEGADERPPPGDESFRIVLSETWVALGRGDEADEAIGRLGDEVSTDASRRAILSGRRALLRSDVEAARHALANATEGPPRTLLEAEIAAATEQPLIARPLFESVLSDARLGLRARIALARTLARAQMWEDAWTVIEPALTAHPTDARVVAAAAAIQAGRGDRARARTLLDERIAALPREPLLLVELARLHAQAAEWDAAFDALTTAIETTPNDAAVQLERGLAARALVRLDVAEEALMASLRLRPGDARALIALFETRIDLHAMDRAAESSAALEAAGVVSPDVDALRARYLVEALAGASGARALRAAIGRDRGNGDLRLALARLDYQAEEWDDAADGFLAASSRLPEQRLLTLAYRALALARARRRPTVEAVIRTLNREAPLPDPVLAVLSVAEAWLERHDEVFGRAHILARAALDRDPTLDDATFLLGVLDHIAGRPADEHLRAVSDVSLEAVGMLALDAPPGDAAGCAGARQYLRGAPDGHLETELRAWVAGCPAAPP